MIVRIVRFRVPARHGHRVFAHARHLASQGGPDGLVHVAVGRQQEDAGDTYVLVTEWRDLDAIYRWVGGRELLSALASLGSLADLATDVDVQHFEGPELVWDASPDLPAAPGAPARSVEAQAQVAASERGILESSEDSAGPLGRRDGSPPDSRDPLSV